MLSQNELQMPEEIDAEIKRKLEAAGDSTDDSVASFLDDVLMESM